MPEIPQRIKVVNGEFAPEFPDECEPHTPSPPGYHARFDWMQEMAKTHVQRQCKSCGLWAVWEPKPHMPADMPTTVNEHVRE